ncbi:MAG: hypothetical protein U0R52_00355 [Solirubrobacterales bacterium]
MTPTKKKRTGLRLAIATVAIVAALAIPGQAFASGSCASAGSSPTESQYCPPTQVITDGGSSGSAARSVSSSSLPFTGLDVISLLAIAAVLTGTGLVVRRLSDRGGEHS